MGAGLKSCRDKVFLTTKTCPHWRDAGLALTMPGEPPPADDRLDFCQIHEVIDQNAPDLIFVPVEPRKRCFGRSNRARCDGSVLADTRITRSISRLLSGAFPFDTVQMPLNCFDAGFRSYERHVLPEATVAVSGRVA